MSTARTRFEYLQHDTHWPRMAGEVADMPAAWHTLEFGKNGWELVSVVRTPTGTLSAFFKRPVSDPQIQGMIPNRFPEASTDQRMLKKKGKA